MCHSVVPHPVARRIDPTRGGNVEDGSPVPAVLHGRHVESPSPLALTEWAERKVPLPDLTAMRVARLDQLRAALAALDLAGILLRDPINIRYAVDKLAAKASESGLIPSACFVATHGPIVVWVRSKAGAGDATAVLIGEVRLSSAAQLVAPYRAQASLAADLAALVRTHGGRNRRLAVDRLDGIDRQALDRQGLELHDGHALVERVRSVKNVHEINAIRCAMAACEAAMSETQSAMQAGMSESELWGVLRAASLKRGCEWVEARRLASGPRTHPWPQECGDRAIQRGDVVALDTDLIGPFGYGVAVARTWLCGSYRASPELRNLYRLAHEHILTNMVQLRAGVSFRELSLGGHQLPPAHRPSRCGPKYHGIGLCDEYPCIPYPEHLAPRPEEDGVLEAGMTLCVEAHVVAADRSCAIKLKNQVLVTATGCTNLTSYPFEYAFLG